MALIALAVIIGVPILEIYTFASVGGEIGPLATVGATLLTAAAGIALFRSQGRDLAARAQESLNRGEMPLAEVVDALGLAMAGILLLIPGFITDAVGFLLFVPPLRIVIVGALLRHMIRSPRAAVWMSRSGPRTPPRADRGPVIDGEFEDVTTPPDPSHAQETADRDDHLPPPEKNR